MKCYFKAEVIVPISPMTWILLLPSSVLLAWYDGPYYQPGTAQMCLQSHQLGQHSEWLLHFIWSKGDFQSVSLLMYMLSLNINLGGKVIGRCFADIRQYIVLKSIEKTRLK